MRVHFGPRRTGLSLLEVLTALAIFMLSIVAISQMMDSGARTARRAQQMTQAAIHCESQMDRLAAGELPMQSLGPEPIPDAEPEWSFTVTCVPEDWTTVSVDGQNVPGLNTVYVTVAWFSGRGDDVEYTLSRVILDPRVRVPATPAAASSPTSSQAGTGGSAVTATGAP